VSDPPSTHEGACLCGAVRYRAEGPLRDVVVCHCSRCRRSHGHVAAYSECATARLEITDDAGALRWYVADERSRGFCSHCGASLFWRRDDQPERTAIAAGTLDEPTGLRTVAHIYTATPGDYYTSAGEGERFAEGITPNDVTRA
jgi:hypothetical protein